MCGEDTKLTVDGADHYTIDMVTPTTVATTAAQVAPLSTVRYAENGAAVRALRPPSRVVPVTSSMFHSFRNPPPIDCISVRARARLGAFALIPFSPLQSKPVEFRTVERPVIASFDPPMRCLSQFDQLVTAVG